MSGWIDWIVIERAGHGFMNPIIKEGTTSFASQGADYCKHVMLLQ
jgi:hypothetical protein